MKTITIEENLVTEVALVWKKKLTNIAEKEAKITLNLTKVQEADIVGVNTLVSTHKLLKNKNGLLEIEVKKDSSLHKILHLTKFMNILSITLS